MRLRPPSVPLITSDPYFSLWSPADCLTDAETCHWTGKPMLLRGIATIDGEDYRIIGATPFTLPAMRQTRRDVEAFTSTYILEAAGLELTCLFTTPTVPDDLYLISRPVSYLEIIARSTDREEHSVRIRLEASEQFCLNEAGEDAVSPEVVQNGPLSIARMGSVSQPILHCSGDDRRIDWGYFYLTAEQGEVGVISREESPDGMAYLTATVSLEEERAMFSFSYDDIESIQYFGKPCRAYWKSRCDNILTVIREAHQDYTDVFERGKQFSDRLFTDAVRAGGEKYAELLLLALRQSIGAHKLVLDDKGELLFLSKENFSNGCIATVDVSYPSIPLYLLYQPELVRGMMRPIYRFAESPAWKFDFAPHDVGQYPLANGQVYGLDRESGEYRHREQMPVEECGNMLLMEAAVAKVTGDVSFAASHLETLEKWSRYLVENGDDPADQLCTDDFAGHLAHNCNLTLKAIMGIAALGLIFGMMGNTEKETHYLSLAKEKAAGFVERARNQDGSYRLAFDRPDTFSLKYNLVWDQLFGTGIVPRSVSEAEIFRYQKEQKAYGVPLDSRRSYTKSDWIIWAATLSSRREEFEAMIAPVWQAYHDMPRRVPMTDWYDAITTQQYGFQCRSVVGGFFLRLLDDKGYLRA